MMSKIVKINSISIVTVFYFPDINTIDYYNNFVASGANVIAVVNGIDDKYLKLLNDIAFKALIINNENLGLAKALNQGCFNAFENHSTHVFLLDQDSRPDYKLPDILFEKSLLLPSTTNFAAVGPSIVDVKSEDNKYQSLKTQFFAMETMITSGTLISREAFFKVGEMYEWLFIDSIDHEWCFRAQGKGMEIIQFSDAIMLHNLGDSGVSLFGRYFPLHRSPIRHKYIVRNTIFMLKLNYVPIKWKITHTAKILWRIPFYIMISTNRYLSFCNIAKSIASFFQIKK